ncbi:nuclease-related domain-containing protein [Fictibacillus aquaticus]|uniref:NERD domain-containing protein n=1 Tax=Fictibacillus aquaticus TaxID=2021314 RepID=A0A235F9D2_9BACL|nr:hypothetical protein CGZ90_08760 [Fictibacillus aquaticus]
MEKRLSRGKISRILPSFFRRKIKNFIFHDLRLTNHIGSFQIDILILTPSYFLILEVKNLSGKITIDPRHQQMTRLNTLGQLDVFPDPLSQVRRQKTQLELWLTAQKITGIPIKTLLVMANPKAN